MRKISEASSEWYYLFRIKMIKKIRWKTFLSETWNDTPFSQLRSEGGLWEVDRLGLD